MDFTSWFDGLYNVGICLHSKAKHGTVHSIHLFRYLCCVILSSTMHPTIVPRTVGIHSMGVYVYMCKNSSVSSILDQTHLFCIFDIYLVAFMLEIIMMTWGHHSKWQLPIWILFTQIEIYFIFVLCVFRFFFLFPLYWSGWKMEILCIQPIENVFDAFISMKYACSLLLCYVVIFRLIFIYSLSLSLLLLLSSFGFNTFTWVLCNFFLCEFSYFALFRAIWIKQRCKNIRNNHFL